MFFLTRKKYQSSTLCVENNTVPSILQIWIYNGRWQCSYKRRTMIHICWFCGIFWTFWIIWVTKGWEPKDYFVNGCNENYSVNTFATRRCENSTLLCTRLTRAITSRCQWSLYSRELPGLLKRGSEELWKDFNDEVSVLARIKLQVWWIWFMIQ